MQTTSMPYEDRRLSSKIAPIIVAFPRFVCVIDTKAAAKKRQTYGPHAMKE